MGIAQETSVIIVTHNHAQYIEKCLRSVIANGPLEIIIVDNDSSDGTPQQVKKNFSRLKIIDLKENLESGKRGDTLLHCEGFSSGDLQRGSESCENPVNDLALERNKRDPQIKLILSPENRGYGAGNNLGVRYAEGKYIVVLNPDTLVEENWLEELVMPLKNKKGIITTPKILLYDGSAINTCGNINHFTGLTFTRGLNEDPGKYDNLEEVSGFSGCCFAIRKSDFEELGGFDEKFFVYNEDSELSWRAHLRGFRILYIPTSVVRHDYKLSVRAEKFYYLERNRYLILRRYFSPKYFSILLPSLLMAEVLTSGYAIRNGWKGVKSKVMAVKDGLTAAVTKEKGNERQLVKSLCSTIPTNQLTFDEIDEKVKVLANRFFDWNYKVAI